MIDVTQNYFQLFGLSEQFELDPIALRDGFQSLQAEYHPDRFTQSTDLEKRVAQQVAGLLNKAYDTLRDEQSRARYLLQLRDVEFNEDKDTTHDLEFLQAQMELREKIDDLPVSEQSIEQLEKFEAEAKTQKRTLADEFIRQLDHKDYAAAKEIVLKMQFFKRLLQQIGRKHEQLEEEFL